MPQTMLTQQQVIDALRAFKLKYQRDLHISKIGLFGSYVRGEQRSDSDIDIIFDIDTDEKKTFDIFDYLELQKKLSEYLSAKIDLVMESSVKEELREIISKEAIYA